jgi:hypothetical protein
MRNSQEIRARTQKTLDSMLARPGMYGRNQVFEFAIRAQLEDLAFIDRRENELIESFGSLEAEGLWSRWGCTGILEGIAGEGGYCTDQLASVYARIASKLGYFHIPRRLGETELKRMAASAQVWCKQTRRERAEVLSEYGEPSFPADAKASGVVAYAGPTDEAWLHFDFDRIWSDAVCRYELRALRLPIQPFRASVVIVDDSGSDYEKAVEVYRQFLMAWLSKDKQQLIATTTGATDLIDAAILWEEDPYPSGVLERFQEQVAHQDVYRSTPPQEKGRIYQQSEGFPQPIAVVRDGEQWKVDPSALIEVRLRAQRQAPLRLVERDDDVV